MNELLDAVRACWNHCHEAIVGFFVAMFGGVASYVRMAKNGAVERGISSFVGHVIVAGFAGLMVFALAKWGGMTNQWGLAFLIGMGGHGGGMVLEWLDQIRDSKLRRLAGDEREP